MRSAEAALASLEAPDPGALARVFIIYGEEPYYQRRLARAIRRHVLDPAFEAFNYTFLEHQAATAGAVREVVLTPPMLASRRLVVVRDPAELLSARSGRKPEAEGEDGEDGSEEGPAALPAADAGDPPDAPPLTASELVKNWCALLPEVSQEVCLVVTLGWDLGDGHALLKTATKLDPPADIIRCLPATPRSAETWVRKMASELGAEIDSDASQALVLRSGSDLILLEGEIKKLLSYVGSRSRVTAEDVLEAATPSAEASVFELVDHIGSRHPYQAVAKLRRLLEQGEAPLRLMAMIVRQVRLVFITREMLASGAPMRDIEGRLGLPTWVARSYLAQARNFDRPQLARMMRSLADMDLAIKTGRQDAAVALELFVLRCG